MLFFSQNDTQAISEELAEAAAVLVEALEVRERYMDACGQSFPYTTSRKLKGKKVSASGVNVEDIRKNIRENSEMTRCRYPGVFLFSRSHFLVDFQMKLIDTH